MSLSGSMNTAVSGMKAQSTRLGAISDNIANAETVGFKREKVSFTSFFVKGGSGNFEAGSVETVTGRLVKQQGELTSTTSSSNLAINGKGFFVVENEQGSEFLTRAGDFEMDDQGDLVNAAGFALMGYSLANGLPANQINGLSGMTRVNLKDELPRAKATTNVNFSSPLDVRKPVVATADLPSANANSAKYSHKTSVLTYDNMGREVKYDIYFSKKADAANEIPATATQQRVAAVDAEWEITVMRADNATNGGFPYSPEPTHNSIDVTFDANGNITSTTRAITITDTSAVPAATIKFDFSSMKLAATDFSPTQNNVDGHAASWVAKAAIDTDGTVFAVYTDGSREPRFRIPLADVQSPDQLESHSGNVFTQSLKSGTTFTGFPGEGRFGTTVAGKLEKSNVDMAAELTEMIQAQRSYTANTKAFQTGSELLDVLVNLKR